MGTAPSSPPKFVRERTYWVAKTAERKSAIRSATHPGGEGALSESRRTLGWHKEEGISECDPTHQNDKFGEDKTPTGVSLYRLI